MTAVARGSKLETPAKSLEKLIDLNVQQTKGAAKSTAHKVVGSVTNRIKKGRVGRAAIAKKLNQTVRGAIRRDDRFKKNV